MMWTLFGAAACALVPQGANLGGWLVLEDWFYGKNGSEPGSAYHVGTPAAQGAVGWSRHIDPASGDFMFSSEVDFLAKADTPVASLRVHRDNYFSVADELREIAAAGAKIVRLPITWAFNWRDEPVTIQGQYGSNVTLPPHLGEQLVEDPFHTRACSNQDAPNLPCRWLSIPEWRVTDVLVIAASLGLRVLLDLHAFPGGSSSGTYNGVWPLAPLFWDVAPATATANFGAIVHNLAQWMAELPQRNASAFAGLYGLTPMNEPGLGMDGGSKPHLDVLATSLTHFKQSGLPELGLKLLMNLISMPDAEVRAWWLDVTSEDERASWAVIDLHHYIAWPGVDWCSDASVSLDELKQRIDKDDAYTWQWSARQTLGLTGTTVCTQRGLCHRS